MGAKIYRIIRRRPFQGRRVRIPSLALNAYVCLTNYCSNRYGSSAGAMSVNLQMLAFGGRTQNLFRGAFMQSGGPLPVGQINEGQVGEMPL